MMEVLQGLKVHLPGKRWGRPRGGAGEFAGIFHGGALSEGQPLAVKQTKLFVSECMTVNSGKCWNLPVVLHDYCL